MKSSYKKHKIETINLAELLGTLSYALDMTEGQPEGHCMRCCWMGSSIGLQLGLDEAEAADLFYALLLKDLGCSSNAARVCSLYLTDDIRFKRDFKTVDGSMSSALRFVFAKTGLESGLSERIRALVNIIQNGGELSKELIETRCERGADIAARMRFSKRVQDGIRSLDEHWDGSGQPEARKGNDIPMIANIALMAQVIDVFATDQSKEAAIKEIKSRSGKWFDPRLVDAFLEAQKDSRFWGVLAGDDLEEHLFNMVPEGHSQPVDEDYLDEIAEAFSDVVDAKSSFTADHSNRVTLYTDIIAEELNLADDHRRWLRRAAMLHDLGKLAVSNQILDKPGPLDDDEWVAVKNHPGLSQKILERIPVFSDIAPIAGAHHERLDGKGYPCGLTGDELCLEVRILTVADVFDALSAERPYRDAMPIAKVFEILEKDIGTAFDADCVAALKVGFQRLTAESEIAA
ncbi:HD-GYP domain-containing protein [Pararhizobium sp. IMCC21322]|uniref:HD-GYP domain-containing protein n=1 Tax=Pararhizobium sp. IMCC21322 TaxID=3067903 RepID=UPI0027425567|nr:HD domain-containing protein [Pararhizobium sp. IMCC21322]